ncbi:MAG: hypothetical protein JNK79_17775 [Chitinophagaceae bacterium]|nr:hypothetical protein [Chitinophagaceae bacterium]
MYQGLVHLHNFLRWIILLLLLIAIVRHFAGMTGKKPFTRGDKKTDTFLMISAHIQGLIGIIQWFFGSFGMNLLSDGAGDLMKDPVKRFWVIEHPLATIIAIALITIGRKAGKQNISDTSKHRKAFWLFLIALIFILASVPWPGREVARPMI